MKKTAVIIVSLVLASIIELAGCRQAAPVVPYEEQTFTVSSYGVEKKTIAMDTGAVFKGYFTVKARVILDFISRTQMVIRYWISQFNTVMTSLIQLPQRVLTLSPCTFIIAQLPLSRFICAGTLSERASFYMTAMLPAGHSGNQGWEV